MEDFLVTVLPRLADTEIRGSSPQIFFAPQKLLCSEKFV